MEENIAIIDLGSNSVRIIVMRTNLNSSYKMIEQIKEMVRLSEGMQKNNLLIEEAMNRTIAALKQFKTIIKSHNVSHIIALATAAVRNADNGNEFLTRIHEETGFNFDVITGEKEAYLDYLGVINTIDIGDCIIIDTGGGSTELVLVKNRIIQHSISIPYGAVTLTEKFLEKENDSKSVITRTEDYIKDIYDSIVWLKEAGNMPVVGLGGSIRTLAKVHKKNYGLINQPIHNYIMTSGDINLIYNQIAGTKSNERKNIAGLNKERADIIMGGLIPLKVLMEYTDSNKLLISGNGLREGAFYKYYFNKYKLSEEIVNNVLQHSVDNILLKYDVNIQHSYLIQKLSLDLFHQLKELHQLDEDAIKLLKISSLLHDIGLHVDYYNHHHHGFYLALNSRINGLTYKELIICAFIIGMHRNEDFKQDLSEYRDVITSDDFDLIQKLSIFIRISEELCKIQNGNIIELKCKATKNNVKIIPISKFLSKIDLSPTLQCEKTFRKLFGRSLILENRK